MKRSEAVNLIELVMYNYGLEDEDQEASNAILSRLEEAGMLPPRFEMEEDGTWGGIRDVKDWYCLEGDFKWEPEEDTSEE